MVLGQLLLYNIVYYDLIFYNSIIERDLNISTIILPNT